MCLFLLPGFRDNRFTGRTDNIREMRVEFTSCPLVPDRVLAYQTGK